MTAKLPMSREAKRAELAKQMEAIPEPTFNTSDDKKRQNLGPTQEARRLAADTPIKIVRKEPVGNLKFREGYERDKSEFKDEQFNELVESIKKDGINNTPIDVREVITRDGSFMEVLAGERRTRALIEAKLPNALIAIRECDDMTADRIHELENRHRLAKAVYSRAVQYVRMLPRYESQKAMAEHLELSEANLSAFLGLITKAPEGMWSRVVDPAAVTWGDMKAIMRAYSSDGFKRYCESTASYAAKDLVKAARRALKKAEPEKSLEKEIFARQRGDRFFVQLPKSVSEVDRRKVVELVLQYFQTKI